MEEIQTSGASMAVDITFGPAPAPSVPQKPKPRGDDDHAQLGPRTGSQSDDRGKRLAITRSTALLDIVLIKGIR